MLPPPTEGSSYWWTVVVSAGPPVAYSCCVSVLPGIVGIELETLRLIGETCTWRYSSTLATGWVLNFRNFMEKIQEPGAEACNPSKHMTL